MSEWTAWPGREERRQDVLSCARVERWCATLDCARVLHYVATATYRAERSVPQDPFARAVSPRS